MVSASPLREWRESKGVTQQELGVAVGLSRTIIGWIEDGQKALTGILREKLLTIDPALVKAQDMFFQERRQELEAQIFQGGDTA